MNKINILAIVCVTINPKSASKVVMILKKVGFIIQEKRSDDQRNGHQQEIDPIKSNLARVLKEQSHAF